MNKRILGGNAKFNLAPVKYKVAWNMFADARKNSWFPEEIGVGDDLLCYQKQLNQRERDLFIRVFSTLTTQDMAVQRNLACCVQDCISAPEFAAFISWQIGQEALHSVSYQYIIEHLSLDEDQVYSMYLREQAINQKFDLADRMSNYFNQYQSTKDVKALLKGLLFYYVCFEGGWFWNGFNPILSLYARGLMKKTADQINYIARDEALHSAFGCHLMDSIMREEGVKLTQDDVEEVILPAVRAETIYSEFAIPPLIGMIPELHIETLQYHMDRQLNSLGIESLFPNAQHKYRYSEQSVGNKEKNFFESRVVEYQVGVGLFNNYDEKKSKTDDTWGDPLAGFGKKNGGDDWNLTGAFCTEKGKDCEACQ